MNKLDFETKLKAMPTAKPDISDLESIERITNSIDNSTISQAELISDIEYSGKVSLRLPKSLHRDLAVNAKNEGVSLNQYLLYKLSH